MRTHPRTTLILPTALLALLTLCAMVVATRAQAGEVHFDPESPAGKEYALPLQQARNEALGTGGGEAGPGGGSGSAGAGVTAPLFGVGVGGKSGGSGPGGEGAGRSGGGSKSEGGGQSSGGGGSSPAAGNSNNANAGAAASASYSDGKDLLLLAGILVLGALIGLGLRALGRQRPATP